MDKMQIIDKLTELWKLAPDLREILTAPASLENKRTEVSHWLTRMLNDVGTRYPQIRGETWHISRDSTRAFSNFLQGRNERLAGFSFLEYLCSLAKVPPEEPPQNLTQGFLLELEHLILGATGQASVYADKELSKAHEYTGRKAALIRSDELDEMSNRLDSYLSRYPCGLEGEIEERRRQNRERVMQYFNAGVDEWNDWRWHVKHVIRDSRVLGDIIDLSEEEKKAVDLARGHSIPFGITPHYVTLMDKEAGRKRDHAVRAQVIPPLDYIDVVSENKADMKQACDFMLEQDTSPVDLITRRYPKIVILKPYNTCPQICVYCQRNWEITDVLDQDARARDDEIERALQWIREHPAVNEVLITGGDPLLLEDDDMESLLAKVAAIPAVRRIRIGTRTFVTLPQRVTDDLVSRISAFHEAGKREVLFCTHFEHSYELSSHSMHAVQKVRKAGMLVYNQLVYTLENARRFEAVALRIKLRLMGVVPYYTFNTKGKAETRSYRVPIARLLQEQKEEARLVPGSERTDEIVFNVPAMGKNYLRAVQHHDVISILPDGHRLYEFHPWQKFLTPFPPYVDLDVPICEFLQRLAMRGENVDDYSSIWYYY